MKEAFLLGAGFSKAVSASMPLMKELPARIHELYRGKLPPSINRMLKRDVESALSFLSQEKPWQREAENLRDRALFLDLSYAIGQVIEQTTTDAIAMMATEPPSWLRRLVEYWHKTNAHVLTLNYDTIVERVAAELFRNIGAPNHLTCLDLYPKYIGRSRGAGGLVRNPEPKTFHLLKLHGSVNWYTSGRQNAPGDAIYCTIPYAGPAGFWSTTNDAREQRESQKVADRIPFIVPPVLEKASLFTHDSICALWSEARSAMAAADRIIVLGYSLPAGDLTMHHFLKSSLAGKRVQIEIVDCRSNVLRHYRRKLAWEKHWTGRQSFTGGDCVSKFVETIPTPQVARS